MAPVEKNSQGLYDQKGKLMITSTKIYGLRADDKIIGGDTSPITVATHVDEAFKLLEEQECVIGCIIQCSECGALEFEPTYWWWGDTTRKNEFLAKLEAYWEDNAECDI